MTDSTWDAIVVGAGPAGSAAAFALASAGRRTLVLERRTSVDFKFGELLPPHTAPLVKRFGLDLSGLIELHARARGVVSVWGDAEVREQDFLFNPYGDGVRLDRPRFDAALRERAIEVGATVVTGARVVDVSPSRDGGVEPELVAVAVEVDGLVQLVSAAHVIDCSGRSAVLARMLGSPRIDFDPLFASARRFVGPTASVDRDPFLRIESVPDGWLYTLVVPSGERMVVFHTDHDLDADLDSALAQSVMVGPILDERGFVPVGRVRASPAGGAWRTPLIARGVLAAGDAVLAFDPLASRGIFGALTTGFGAADAVVATADGDDGAIDRYIADVEATTTEYRSGHRRMYASEQRFSDRPFWARRLTDASAH